MRLTYWRHLAGPGDAVARCSARLAVLADVAFRNSPRPAVPVDGVFRSSGMRRARRAAVLPGNRSDMVILSTFRFGAVEILGHVRGFL